MREKLSELRAMECHECWRKQGSRTLCRRCLRNTDVVDELKRRIG